MNLKDRFQEIKSIRIPDKELDQTRVDLSKSGEVFLIRIGKKNKEEFFSAVNSLKQINDFYLKTDHRDRARYNSELKFWTLPVNEISIDFIQLWAKVHKAELKFKIEVELDDWVTRTRKVVKPIQ